MHIARLETVKGARLLESAVFFSNSLSDAKKLADIERGLRDAAERHKIEPDVVDAAVAGLAKPGQSAEEAARFLLTLGMGAGYEDQVRTAVAGAGKKQGSVDRGLVSSAVVAGLVLVLERANPGKIRIEIDRVAGTVQIQMEDTNSGPYSVGKDLASLLSQVEALSGPPATVPLGQAGIQDVAAMLREMDRIDLSEYVVVGKYLRYDSRIRNNLKEQVVQIQAPLLRKTDARENFLIWAAPGSGKTFFIEQIAEDLNGKLVSYVPCNLAIDGQQRLDSKLCEVEAQSSPVLCLLDEIDAHPLGQSDYEVCFTRLDLNTKPGSQVVFVLVGSTPPSMASMVAAIEQCHKGPDLLSRVPSDKRFDIPGLTPRDGATMIVGQVADLLGTQVKKVDKLALLYILSNETLKGSPRQLAEFVKAAADRLRKEGDERLRFHHLFSPGDPGKKQFQFRKDNESLCDEFGDIDLSFSP